MPRPLRSLPLPKSRPLVSRRNRPLEAYGRGSEGNIISKLKSLRGSRKKEIPPLVVLSNGNLLFSPPVMCTFRD
jgi:hypothetical protein